MAGHKDIGGVLTEADATLQAARLGLDDFLHGATPSRRLAGLRNVIVWGRAVTNVLQSIKTFDREHFENWYAPHQTAMRDNPNFRYLYNLRSQILKEGVLGGISGSLYIDYFNTSQIDELPRPPGASSFFLGDRLGGSGWIIKLADGTEETYYAELPTHWRMKAEAHFVDVTTQLGLEPPTKPIDELLTEYLDYLMDLVKDARREFAVSN
jgi:hypothetical protein